MASLTVLRRNTLTVRISFNVVCSVTRGLVVSVGAPGLNLGIPNATSGVERLSLSWSVFSDIRVSFGSRGQKMAKGFPAVISLAPFWGSFTIDILNGPNKWFYMDGNKNAITLSSFSIEPWPRRLSLHKDILYQLRRLYSFSLIYEVLGPNDETSKEHKVSSAGLQPIVQSIHQSLQYIWCCS